MTEPSKLFQVRKEYYELYTRDKNYLSVFSKEDIEHYLFQSFPKAVDLSSEKKRRQIKQTFTFDII